MKNFIRKIIKITVLIILLKIGFLQLLLLSDNISKDKITNKVNGNDNVPIFYPLPQPVMYYYETYKYFDKIFQNIIDHSPQGKCRRHYKDICKITKGLTSRNDDYDLLYELSYESLGNCLDFTPQELHNLTETHSSFIESLGEMTLPSDAYKGDGIVTIGGGKFSLISFLSIKRLRDLGTTFPIEVFIPPSTGLHNEQEEEEQFCNELLPKYNAKCIFIDRILSPAVINRFQFKGYQFKALAIIASSFQNILFLDSDNSPIKNLNNIFKSRPFEKYGLILWPDYWRRSTTPYYYQVAGIPFDTKKRVRNAYDDITPPEVYTKDMKNLDNVPLHDMDGTIPDVSTESGQLLINKKKHLNTLLLSLYYNINGPTWYYPMLTQKAAGEGDKETFIAAANFFKLPFYQVKTPVKPNGHHRKGKYTGVAMIQHDFIQDYTNYEIAQKNVAQKYPEGVNRTFDIDYDLNMFLPDIFSKQGQMETMFIHSNLPKFEPLHLWTNNMGIDNETGEHFRLYGDLKMLNGFDIEKSNIQLLNNLFCRRSKMGTLSRVNYFTYISATLDGDYNSWEKMCDYLSECLTFLRKTHRETA